MKTEFEIIKKRVKQELKNRNVTNVKIIDDFTQTCFDDYKLSLENGENENDSLKHALSALTETLDYSPLYNQKTPPYRYSLALSSIAFAICVVIALIGWLAIDLLSFFGVIYPIFFLIATTVLIYTIATYKKRNVIDFIVATLLFLGFLSITVEACMYFYRATTANFHYSIWYYFPGLLKFNRLTSVLDGSKYTKYKITGTVLLFDPTLIVSLICLIIGVTYTITEKKKATR